jgi:hypothetical protein
VTVARKCLCCGKTSAHIAVKNVEALGEEGALASAVLACTRCDFVLGAGSDPIEYVSALMRQIPPDAPRARLTRLNGAMNSACNVRFRTH